jgi:hypothetical protein
VRARVQREEDREVRNTTFVDLEAEAYQVKVEESNGKERDVGECC